LPSLRSIAADTNVLLSAVAKRAARRVFNVFYETIEHLPLRLYDESEYRSHVDEARRYLEHRDPDDVALTALALKLDVPIWSNDNDFRDLPIPFYTTAALLRALGM